MYSINDLKTAIGTGLRKNKYLIELSTPIIGTNEAKLNSLCQSASFPERILQTTEVWNRGRKYNMRAETDFGSTWSLTFFEDTKSSVRSIFDAWIKKCDNSHPVQGGVLSGASYEGLPVSDILNSILEVADDIKDFVNDPLGGAADFISDVIDPNQTSPVADYQSDITVWSLDNNRNKIYGYKMQNCFPVSIGAVEFSDSDVGSIVTFTVTFAYSEFMPITNSTPLSQFTSAIIGDAVSDSIATAERLYDSVNINDNNNDNVNLTNSVNSSSSSTEELFD